MKYKRMLRLLVSAVVGLMAFPGVASATTVTADGVVYTGEVVASSENFTLHNNVGTMSCFSSIKFKIEVHSQSGSLAGGKVSTFDSGPCWNGSVHTSGVINAPGSLSIDSNDKVMSTGAAITITMLGLECGYATNSTYFGVLTTGSEHAVLDVKGAKLPRTHGSGGIFCGSTAELTGSYKITTPTKLTID